MKRFKSSGFGIVQLIIFLGVIGLIGVTGYSVYKVQNKKESPKAAITNFDECVAAGNPVMESYPEQCAADGKTFRNKITDSYSEKDINDWNSYSGLGLAFKYPKNWIQDKNRGNNLNVSADFISSDFKEATELGPSVEAGHWLELYVSDTNNTHDYKSYDEHLKALQESEQGCGGDFYTSTIDGMPAIISDIQCHGTSISATTYKGNNVYYLRFNSLDDDDPKNIELFNAILSTIDIL